MNQVPHNLSNLECFNKFKQSPKDVPIAVVKGAHKYIAKAIKKPESGPTCGEMIKIFAHFSKNKIKDYVFTRMTKPILLELALCIVQEIVLNGIGRAETLQLELVKTKFGGKTVKIADPFKDQDDELDDEFLGNIDEAFFRLRDSEGNSPDVNVVAGQGHKAPYSPFGKDGGFLRPKPRAARSLAPSIEVVCLWPYLYHVLF